jgi:hypothetical protein
MSAHPSRWVWTSCGPKRWQPIPARCWSRWSLTLAVAELKAELVPILRAQVKEAKKGSLAPAQWIFQVMGLWSPKQQHEHTGGTGGPLRIVIETVDDCGPPDVLMPAPSARLR